MFENTSTLYSTFRTQKKYDEIIPAIVDALRGLGGQIQVAGNTITIFNGKQGISNNFVVQINARCVVTERKPGEFEVQCVITHSPEQIFWICLIVGFFCLWPAWIVCAFYFMVNTVPTYQAALDRIAITMN